MLRGERSFGNYIKWSSIAEINITCACVFVCSENTWEEGVGGAGSGVASLLAGAASLTAGGATTGSNSCHRSPIPTQALVAH